MKQAILNTPFAKFAMNARDKFDIFKEALTNYENLSITVNSQISRLLVTQLCHSHKTFIDVGAHIGSIISLVSDFDKTIKIIAIEAVPDKAEKLRRQFPQVIIHACAVGNAEGEVSFYVNTTQSGYSSLREPDKDKKSNSVKISVPLKRLDDLVLSDDVDVIKIDVEGCESEVLYGSENIILKNRPVIMFESIQTRENDWKSIKMDMWSWLNSHSYELFIPNRVSHDGPGLGQEGFIESHYYPRRTHDYFAIPIERRDEIKELARNIMNIKPKSL
ncbi:FkbM family methyltransferase [Gloeocapsa sp. PCC 73106]|uniref:FkbM family methyltransferase n=1 Tax=Gloeocapsa sp. PCC 73106 TaxID=102232 RepID=UPI0002ABF2AF|nr:FkbM family methyltransferase [Gloeocapsa sp. PCC 73106]ELR98855.1 methyltransferase, FkbM family [Gloeocapsa sp. PCC 73106]